MHRHLRTSPVLTGLAVAGLTITFVLTACTPSLPEKNMQSPAETHVALNDAISSTVEFLGGSEGWSDYGDNPPRECSVNGVDGVYYVEDSIGPGVASDNERDDTVARVREHLESLGMTTRLAETSEADNIVRVLASGGPTEALAVYVSTDQLVVTGDSWCVPGDWREMIRKYAD